MYCFHCVTSTCHRNENLLIFNIKKTEGINRTYLQFARETMRDVTDVVFLSLVLDQILQVELFISFYILKYF